MNIKKFYKFYSEVMQEAKKIVWPERKDVLVTFLVVVLVIILCSLFFLFFDYIIHHIILFLLNIGK